MKILTEIPDELVSAFYKSNKSVGLEQYLVNLLANSLYGVARRSETDVDTIINEAYEKAVSLKSRTSFKLKELVDGFAAMPSGFRRQLGKDFKSRLLRHNAEKGVNVFEFNHTPGRTDITKVL